MGCPETRIQTLTYHDRRTGLGDSSTISVQVQLKGNIYESDLSYQI